jgi:hypothetical protein
VEEEWKMERNFIMVVDQKDLQAVLPDSGVHRYFAQI